MRATINKEKFAAAVRLQRGKASLRDAEAETGINRQTIKNIEDGSSPRVDTFATLCRWMKVPTDYFVMDDHDDDRHPAAA